MVEIFDDIRKIYRFAPPCEELADYVEFFSETCPEASSQFFPDGQFSVKMFPSWTPTIWVNLSAPYSLMVEERKYLVTKGKDILVLRNSIVSRNVSASDRIFTIKFHPGAIHRIFGIAQQSLIDRVADAGDLIPAGLLKNLKVQNNLEARVKLIEVFLLQKLSGLKKTDHYVKLMRDSIDLYFASGMQINATQLAERQFTTSKTINRYFQRTIGLSPKKYLSILRARSAIGRFLDNRKEFDPELHGYYDMSHFYREAHKFTHGHLRVTT